METIYTSQVEKLLLTIAKQIASLNETIEDAKFKMETAFLYNFEWSYPEILYKAMYEKEKLGELSRFVKEQPERAFEWLNHNIEIITEDLLRGNYVGQSTSVYSNMAHTYKKEVDATLLKFYKILLKALNKTF